MSVSRGTEKHELRGTHRTVPPSTTIALVAPFFERFGITRVANVTGLDTIGIPTVLVVRPNSKSLSVSQGKGLDLDAAKASGIMESIEHHHAENLDLPLKFASYHDLSRRRATVEPSRLPGYVRPFDPHRAILWTEARSLSDDAEILVPFEMVHVDLTLPLPPGSGFFPIGSNGLASGNTLPEAIVHAVWELVERDAVSLFYRASVEEQWLRRVRLDSVDDAAAHELLSRLRAAGVRVAIWDVTSDLGIAAFFASIVEDQPDPFRRVGKASGFGCHADRGVALCRALTEAAQSRLTRITGSRDDIQRADFELIRAEATIERQRAELDDSVPAPHDFRVVPSRRFATFEEDIAWTRQRLAQAGLDRILIVDLSRPDLPVAVVRAIVPGLEGSAEVPGYVPGPRALARGTGA